MTPSLVERVGCVAERKGRVTARPALPITSVKRAAPNAVASRKIGKTGTPFRTQDLPAATAKSHPQVANCPQSADGALGGRVSSTRPGGSHSVRGATVRATHVTPIGSPNAETVLRGKRS